MAQRQAPLRGEGLGERGGRLPALLRQRGVVDHQNRIRSTHQPIGLGRKLGLERGSIPDCGRDEVMELIVARLLALGDRLDALSLTRADESASSQCNVRPCQTRYGMVAASQPISADRSLNLSRETPPSSANYRSEP